MSMFNVLLPKKTRNNTLTV